MPTYKVTAKGFFNGKMYDPESKRKFLHTDKPFNKKNPLPSWLEEIPEETESERKARKAAEASAVADNKKKHDDDQKDIENASFLDDPGSDVVTL